jgi:hypothetical protein
MDQLTLICDILTAASRVLYQTSLQCLQALATWFSRSWTRATSATSQDDDMEDQSDMLLTSLQLLNALATKDFLLDDQFSGEVVDSAAEHALICQVVRI